MNSFFKDWLSFSKKERLGILSLVLVIAFFLVIPAVYSPKLEAPPIDTGLFRSLKSDSNEKIDSIALNRNSPDEPIAKKEFYFDPNSLDENGWKDLGISQKTIRTIINYRNKGGQFKTPSDIRKIWGLLSADADRLIPFVRIPEKMALTNAQEHFSKSPPKIIDINQATASDWESLPGIGPVLANRILHFKEKLGGYTSIEQVGKTYGISEVVFSTILPFLTLDSNLINRKLNGSIQQTKLSTKKDSILNINNATVAQLIQSGIDVGVAKAIVLYRKQYGRFNQLADIKKIVFINEAIYQQIVPKLKVE